MNYLATKMVDLALTLEVEADSEEEALEKIAQAWGDSETFVRNVLYTGDIGDSEDYINPVQDASYYSGDIHTLDELCTIDYTQK